MMCLPRDEEILPQTRSPAPLLQSPASLFALLLLSCVTLGKPLKLLPSPQTGGATLTYLTMVFWIHQQHLLWKSKVCSAGLCHFFPWLP